MVIYDNRHAIDMIALHFKSKILCFPQKLSRGHQWVRQSALHCTTEAMTIHNDQSSIKRICMTLKCMCVFLLFPLRIFSWRPIKYDSVTPYGFFMTTDKKRQCYPLYFIWQRQQCYPLCFFSWRPIKNNSVTPYGFFHDDQRKTTVSPLMFHLIKTTVTPYVFFMTTKEKQQCYPLCFIW